MFFTFCWRKRPLLLTNYNSVNKYPSNYKLQSRAKWGINYFHLNLYNPD